MFTRIGVPQSDGFVSASASDSAPIGIESDAINRTLVPCECLPVSTRISVPETDCIVPTAASDCASIRTECDAIDPIRVAYERALVICRISVPQTDYVVSAVPLAIVRPLGLKATLLTAPGAVSVRW